MFKAARKIAEKILKLLRDVLYAGSSTPYLRLTVWLVIAAVVIVLVA